MQLAYFIIGRTMVLFVKGCKNAGVYTGKGSFD